MTPILLALASDVLDARTAKRRAAEARIAISPDDSKDYDAATDRHEEARSKLEAVYRAFFDEFLAEYQKTRELEVALEKQIADVRGALGAG